MVRQCLPPRPRPLLCVLLQNCDRLIRVDPLRFGHQFIGAALIALPFRPQSLLDERARLGTA